MRRKTATFDAKPTTDRHATTLLKIGSTENPRGAWVDGVFDATPRLSGQ